MRRKNRMRPGQTAFQSFSSVLLLLLPTVLLLSNRCSSRDIERHIFRIIEEDGVPTAITIGGPKYADLLFTYEEVLTLQQDEEQIESLLFRPSAFLMDEEGFVYVSDNGNYRIAVFDQEGQYSHSIGRKGGGPGEFQDIYLLSVREDKVAVYDHMQQRTSVFQTNGTLLNTLSCLGMLQTVIVKLYPGPNNILIPFTQIWDEAPNSVRYEYWRVTVVTAQGDTLGMVETPRVNFGSRFVDKGIRSTAPVYFGGRAQAVYVPDRGILTTTGNEPVLWWYNLDGSLQKVIRIEIEREAVTREERGRIIKNVEDQITGARSEMQRLVAEAQRTHLQIPDTKDFWSGLIVDDSDFIWLRKCVDPYNIREENNTPYRVLSPEGEYLGDTVWPDSEGWISHGHFLAYRQDEGTGDITPIVYRIRPTIRGLRYP